MIVKSGQKDDQKKVDTKAIVTGQKRGRRSRFALCKFLEKGLRKEFKEKSIIAKLIIDPFFRVTFILENSLLD